MSVIEFFFWRGRQNNPASPTLPTRPRSDLNPTTLCAQAHLPWTYTLCLRQTIIWRQPNQNRCSQFLVVVVLRRNWRRRIMPSQLLMLPLPRSRNPPSEPAPAHHAQPTSAAVTVGTHCRPGRTSSSSVAGGTAAHLAEGTP
jgi:hypothetical protein